jgi:hypothetical protein
MPRHLRVEQDHVNVVMKLVGRRFFGIVFSPVSESRHSRHITRGNAAGEFAA